MEEWIENILKQCKCEIIFFFKFINIFNIFFNTNICTLHPCNTDLLQTRGCNKPLCPSHSVHLGSRNPSQHHRRRVFVDRNELHFDTAEHSVGGWCNEIKSNEQCNQERKALLKMDVALQRSETTTSALLA